MKININKTLAVSEWENDTLEMTKVSRADIGAYLCIASVSGSPIMRIINYFYFVPLEFNSAVGEQED